MGCRVVVVRCDGVYGDRAPSLFEKRTVGERKGEGSRGWAGGGLGWWEAGGRRAWET